MKNEILKLASTKGVWAALSIALIFYILKSQKKKNKKQEKKDLEYQEIISNLTDEINITKEKKKDIEEIKSHLINQQ